tara:strand:+ start:998 stop:1174 length:177 start_codon:yes stop_codon:yes gene_type:complete
MGIQISRRTKQLLSLLKKLIKEEYLYTDDELRRVKEQIKIIEEEISISKTKQSKGFGK